MTIIIQYQLLLIIASIIWIPYRLVIFIIKKNRFNKKSIQKEAIYYLFIIYLAMLIGVTLFPIRIGVLRYHSLNINLIPFNFEIFSNLKIGLIVIFGNIVLLSPLSIFLPILNKDKFNSLKLLFIIALITSLSIELLQLLTCYLGISDIGRVSDINDVIFNCSGIFLGHFIYKNLLFKFNINKE